MGRNQGGDRGKGPNVTGTLPRKRVDAPATKPGRKDVKGGAGPKKMRRGTTTRSGDK